MLDFKESFLFVHSHASFSLFLFFRCSIRTICIWLGSNSCPMVSEAPLYQLSPNHCPISRHHFENGYLWMFLLCIWQKINSLWQMSCAIGQIFIAEKRQILNKLWSHPVTLHTTYLCSRNSWQECTKLRINSWTLWIRETEGRPVGSFRPSGIDETRHPITQSGTTLQFLAVRFEWKQVITLNNIFTWPRFELLW